MDNPIPAGSVQQIRDLYLSTMVRMLTNTIYEDESILPRRAGAYDEQMRKMGQDWPSKAFTMIGVRRLTNLRDLCERSIQANVPGDFIETGVWRGGACIMMRAVLAAYGETGRKVICADSFRGIPPSNPDQYPADRGKNWDSYRELAITQKDVAEAFNKFGLLDQQVEFLEGWFKDTLPTLSPDRTFAVIRLDGDLYESTIQALEHLYPKLSPGGYAIIDDYGLPPCEKAVQHYRKRNAIDAPIQPIDGMGVWWQKK
jgi:O-methyltransferase